MPQSSSMSHQEEPGEFPWPSETPDEYADELSNEPVCEPPRQPAPKAVRQPRSVQATLDAEASDQWPVGPPPREVIPEPMPDTLQEPVEPVEPTTVVMAEDRLDLLDRLDRLDRLPDAPPLIEPQDNQEDASPRPRHPLAGMADKPEYRRTVMEQMERGGDIWKSLESFGEHDRSRPRDTPQPGPAGHVGAPAVTAWEAAGEKSSPRAFLVTLKEVLLNPVAFFDGLEPQGGVMKPLVFFLILRELEAVAMFLHHMAGLSIEAVMGTGQTHMMGLDSLPMLVMYPFTLSFFLLVMAAVVHGLLLLVGSGRKGFKTTFRGLAYAHAPFIFTILPILGSVMALIWFFAISAVGLKRIHRSSYLQVVPVLLVFFGLVTYLASLFYDYLAALTPA